MVDDAAPVRAQLNTALSQIGISVVEADCGETALQMLRDGSVDLMIVDINMPGMSGADLIEAARNIPAHRDTPIFVLTTESAPSLVDRCRALGTTAWMIKPFRADSLLRGVERVLGA